MTIDNCKNETLREPAKQSSAWGSDGSSTPLTIDDLVGAICLVGLIVVLVNW